MPNGFPIARSKVRVYKLGLLSLEPKGFFFSLSLLKIVLHFDVCISRCLQSPDALVSSGA